MDDARLDLLAVQVYSWTPHLETVGEICLREAQLGRRVGFVFLDTDNADEFPVGFALVSWLRRIRLLKLRRLQRLLRANGVTVLPVARLTGSPPMELSSASAGIDTADSLKRYCVGGAALGIGTLSSVIDILGDTEPDVAANRELIDALLNSALETFLLTRALIERHRPLALLVSNGRLASSKGTTEAARLSGVAVRYCELGANFERFYLSNRPPQSFQNARDLLRSAWESAGNDREAIAAKFFAPDRGGADLPFADFSTMQEKGATVPLRGRRRLVYYASSDDEHAAVEDGMEHELFASQRRAVTWLADWVRARPEFELIVRVHPRMKVLSPRELGWWNSLAAPPNVTVLPADHHVDSYALARTAEKVLCYRSSMGPEATYLGRAAILLGDAVYKGLDCVYEPSTVTELDSLLQAMDVPPKPRDNCLPYGYERLMRGTAFRFYRAISPTEGLFLGRNLKPSGYDPLMRTIFRLDKAIRVIRERSWGTDVR